MTQKPQCSVYESYISWVAQIAEPVAIKVEELQNVSRQDAHTVKLREAINSDKWTPDLKYYEIIKPELCCYGSLVLRGTRVFIPRTLRRRVLALAHEGHLGIVKTKQRLRSKVWWPLMDKEVELYCRSCHGCQTVSQIDPPEPITSTELPSRAWEYLAADYLGPLPGGKYILVVVDYFSRYVETVITTIITAEKTMAILSEIFARFGFPKQLRTDRGPQFISDEFRKFCVNNGIEQILTTPRYPQANGEVERQNRSILKILKIAHSDKQNLQQALNDNLLAYRSTPHVATGVSPAKLMFGREMQCKLPNVTISQPVDQAVINRDLLYKAQIKEYADNARKARASNVQVGDSVLVRQQHTDKLSPEFCPNPYTPTARKGNTVVVQSSQGAEYTRNTTFVKKYTPTEKTQVPKDDVQQGEMHQGQEGDTSPAQGGLRRSQRSVTLPLRFRQ
jgi:transposase InsO family protein